MSQFLLIAQQVVNLLTCNRRNTAVPYTCRKKAPGIGAKRGKQDGKPCEYHSSESTDLDSDPAAISSSGSDTEAASSPTPLNERFSSVRGPPGLELPRGGFSRQKKGGASVSETYPIVETKPCAPTTRTKNSKLELCLNEITTNTSENDIASSLGEVLKRRLQREQSEPPRATLPSSLQTVLSKLSAGDAAIVKAAFEANEASRKAPEPTAARFPRAANITEDNTLRSNLQKLTAIDANRIFMVRKIGKLGLSSPEMLKTYFSKFGLVANVFVTHSIDKTNLDVEDSQAIPRPRVRPAGVGFVVMEKTADVVNIFTHGLEHKILGVLISLTAYEHHAPALPPSGDTTRKAHGPRFPTYANITEDNTLRANLRKMSEVDANRIFMVRKISKLGLGSAQLLKTHFGQFGGVANVFVTHSIDKRKADPENPNAKPHVRPAGIGFIVMDKAEDVDAILQQGLEHVVYGTNINVASYEHQMPEDSCSRENDDVIPATEADPSTM